MIVQRYIQALCMVVAVVCLAGAQELRHISNEEARTHLAKRVEPVYPKMAEIAHIQGVVNLEITINESGSVTDPRALSGHPILVQSALDAVKQWEFQPFLEEGKPTAVRAAIKIDFFFGPGAELRSSYLKQEAECIQQLHSNKFTADGACKQALETALKLPTNFNGDKMLAYGNAGTAAYNQNRAGEALEDFQHQLAFAHAAPAPDQVVAQIYGNVAHAYEATGNMQEADAAYTEAEKAQRAALADLERLREQQKASTFTGIKASYIHSMQVILEDHIKLLRKMEKTQEADALEQKAAALKENN